MSSPPSVIPVNKTVNQLSEAMFQDIPSGGVERGLLAAEGSDMDLIEEQVGGRTANDVKTIGLIRDDEERGGGAGIVDV